MTEKPLPFIYQFGAGAIAGVSEVCPRPVFQCQVSSEGVRVPY